MDIPTSKIKRLLSTRRPEIAETIANQLSIGGRLMDSVNTPEGQALIEVISSIYQSTFNDLMNMVVDKKYNKEEELWRVRELCIGLDKLNDILRHWRNHLQKLHQHLDAIDALPKTPNPDNGDHHERTH